MKVSIKIPVQDARDIVYGDHPDWESVVLNNLVGTNRWSNCYEDVHKHIPTGKYYEFYYTVGATEQQDESPYEFETGDIEVFEVVQKEVVQKIWVIKE